MPNGACTNRRALEQPIVRVCACAFVQLDGVLQNQTDGHMHVSSESQKKGGSSAYCPCYSVCNNTERRNKESESEGETKRERASERERRKEKESKKVVRQTIIKKRRRGKKSEPKKLREREKKQFSNVKIGSEHRRNRILAFLPCCCCCC